MFGALFSFCPKKDEEVLYLEMEDIVNKDLDISILISSQLKPYCSYVIMMNVVWKRGDALAA